MEWNGNGMKMEFQRKSKGKERKEEMGKKKTAHGGDLE